MFSRLFCVVFVLLLVGGSLVSGSTVWNGNFNDYTTTSDFDKWSWSDQSFGSYQTYIFGDANSGTKMSTYLNLNTSYRNPNDATVLRGLRVQIDSSSKWHGQTMLRTELIGKYDQNTVYQGTKYFQFSMKQGSQNQLRGENEHQLVFFEAHFAAKWSSDFTPETWFNFAIQVDYSGGKVGFWQSTGKDPLKQVVPLTSTSVSHSDWHIGSLRLPVNNVQASNTEWLYYSGIYINTAIAPFPSFQTLVDEY